MLAIIYLFILVLLPAAIAFILASTLPRLFPEMSHRSQTFSAAGAAGCLPMALPMIGLVIGASYGGFDASLLIPVAALLVVALIIALVIGLPVAMLAQRGKGAPPDSADFD